MNLAQRILIQSIENIVSFMFSFLVQILIVVRLSPQDFAVFNYIFLLIILSTNFLDFGISDLIIKKRSYAKKNPLAFLTGSLFISVFFVVALLGTEFTVYQLGLFGEYGLPLITYIALAYLLIVNGYMTYLLRSHLILKQIAVIRVSSLVILCLAIAGLPSVLQPHNLVLLAYLISEIFRACWLGLVVLRMNHAPVFPKELKATLSLKTLRTIYSASYGFHMAKLLGYFSRNADLYLAGMLLSGMEFAKYVLAFRLLGAPVRQLSGTLNKVVFPEYARLTPAKRLLFFQSSFPAVVNFSFFAFGLLGVNATIIAQLVDIGDWHGIEDIIVPVAIACAFLVGINYSESFTKSFLPARTLTFGTLARTTSTIIIFYAGINISLMFAVWALISAYAIQLGIILQLAAWHFDSYALFAKRLLLTGFIFALYAGILQLGGFGIGLTSYVIVETNLQLLIVFLLLDAIFHSRLSAFSFVAFFRGKLGV